MSGYTESIISQSMAGFFHESKSAVLDNKVRQELVSKSRVLCQKVPLAKAIINALNRGVIGSGLHLAVDNPDFERDSSMCSFDAKRQMDLYQMQQQIFETTLLSGECFLIREKSDDDGISAYFLAEPDHVFNPPYSSMDGDGNAFVSYRRSKHLLIDGIEYSPYGKPLAMHYCISPYSNYASKKSWVRIPFVSEDGKPNIIHSRLIDRPEYPRGLPILAPLIETLYSLYALTQSQVQMGILQSCQALVIKTNTNKSLNPLSGLTAADLNAPLIPKETETPAEAPKQEFSIVPPNNRDTFGLLNTPTYVSPGQTIHLAPDESLECVSPASPSDKLSDFYDLVLEQCGSCLGIPKPLLSGVFDASFSASKASIAQWIYATSKYRKMFISQVLKPLYRLYIMEKDLPISDSSTEWINLDPNMYIDEVRTMSLYKDAYELGLVTKDEIAQTLFSHRAVTPSDNEM